MTMKTLHRSERAPELNHLRPLSTYSSPSRSMVSAMLVASDDAESGSVMQKALRISPASSGTSHCDLISSDPKRCSTSMLPVSGALQLSTSEANDTLPSISEMGA